SVPQLSAAFKRMGLKLPNLQADVIEEALEDPDLTRQQRRARELRADLAGSAIKKYPAAAAAVCADGRVRGGFQFYGAHTCRWTGRRVQPQNLPRASFDTPEEAEAAVLDLKLGLGADPAALKALVRSMFMGDPELTVVDYAAIEARVLAWLAGEEWPLEAFRA